MADVIRKMRAGHKTSDIDDTIDEVASAKGTYTTLSERLSGIESEQESQGEALDENRAALVEIVDSGAKNRLNYNIATFGDKSKVTINQDGSITGSITSDTRQYAWSNREFEFTLPAGDYVLCIKRLSGSNVYTSVRLMTAENNNICTVATNPNIAPSTKSFTLDTDTTIGFIGKVFTDTIQLMLCTKAAWDISHQYVPHRPSYDELIARIEALEGGK